MSAHHNALVHSLTMQSLRVGGVARDNGMHGSASPFEAFAELVNWTGEDPAAEPFGAAMLAAGISADTVKAWSVDPQVTLPDADGKKGSLFDSVEDTNAADCLATLVKINGCQ